MPELGIGGIQTLHMSSLGGFTYPTDVASSRRWFGEDIIEPPIVVRNGMIDLPGAPGNGVALVDRIMQRHRVAEQVFTSATKSGSA
jgi:O-succinylbenzoate synthase